MNPKFLVIILLALGFAYRLLLQLVSFRSANNPTPENVKDVYDADTYLTWKKYSADKHKLNILSTFVSLAFMLVILLTNFNALTAGIFGKNVYLSMIAVVLVHTAIEWALNLYFHYTETMVIEQKYGFNRTTMKTFVIDRIRGLLIELILTIGLMAILTLLHTKMQDWIILLFTIAVFIISLLISFLYPVLSRIGNKFTPLEEGELRERLMNLLTKNGYKVKDIKVMDASRRTTKLNAYFTGFGKLKTIVLFDNLVNAMSADEICAVFAHELGHGLYKDVPKQQVMNLVNLFLMAVVAWLCVRTPELHQAFGFESVNYGFAYLLMGIGLGLVQPVTGMLMSAYSRFAEYRADRQAVKEGYGEALITGLKKLAKGNFAHLAPSRILVVLEYSHPPLAERIAAIEKELKK